MRARPAADVRGFLFPLLYVDPNATSAAEIPFSSRVSFLSEWCCTRRPEHCSSFSTEAAELEECRWSHDLDKQSTDIQCWGGREAAPVADASADRPESHQAQQKIDLGDRCIWSVCAESIRRRGYGMCQDRSSEQGHSEQQQFAFHSLHLFL